MAKIRQVKQIVNKSIHLALRIALDGGKGVLDLWCHAHESAKWWLPGLTNLKNSGLQDALIGGCNRLTGFPSVIETVYPRSIV